MPRKSHVVVPAQRADLHHDVVRAAGPVHDEAHLPKYPEQPLAPFLVGAGQPLVVRRRKVEGERARFLQRRRRAHGEEVVDLADGVRQGRGCDRPAHPPPGHAVGLAHPVDGDGARGHFRQRGERDVDRAVVQDVLVDLVGHRDRIVPPAQLGDRLQLHAREDLARGVVGSVDDDGPRALREGALQLRGVEVPLRRPQAYEARHRAGEDRVGAVVLVEGLEDDHLVAGIEHREKGGNHGLGRPARDRDLTLGVHGQAVEPLELPRDGLAQRPRPPSDGVLVDVGGNGAARRFFHLFGSREIGEALGEVDRPVQLRQARHLADHRFGEALGLGRRPDAHSDRLSSEAASTVMSGGSGRVRSMWPASVSAGLSSTRIWTRFTAGKLVLREFTTE